VKFPAETPLINAESRGLTH